MNNRIKKYSFTLLCFFIYQLLWVISPLCGLNILQFELLIIIYLLLLIFVLNKLNYLKDIHIIKLTDYNLVDFICRIPLLLIPLVNIIDNYSIDFDNIIMCFIIVFFEELIFRGVLLKTFDDFPINKCILLCSFLFSIYHMSNLFVNTDILYIIFQVVLSFFVGYHLCFVTIKTKSLLPSIIIHFFINITGSGSMVNIYNYIICGIVLSINSIHLSKSLIREE